MNASTTHRASRHSVDVHVGARLRARRKMLRMSQGDLAEQLGITFQQIQKYERGQNRVSASKLFEAAMALTTSINFFFEGLDGPPTGHVSEIEHGVNAFLSTADGVQLAASFPRIRSAQQRRKLLELVKALSAD